MNTIYTIVYIAKKDIADNGKFETKKIKSELVRASDATRAINTVKKELVEKGTVEAAGDIKVLEARLGF